MFKLTAHTQDGLTETSSVRKAESVFTRFPPDKYRWLTVVRTREDGMTVTSHYVAGTRGRSTWHWNMKTQVFSETKGTDNE